jgi:hypothetical protein
LPDAQLVPLPRYVFDELPAHDWALVTLHVPSLTQQAPEHEPQTEPTPPQIPERTVQAALVRIWHD